MTMMEMIHHDDTNNSCGIFWMNCDGTVTCEDAYIAFELYEIGTHYVPHDENYDDSDVPF